MGTITIDNDIKVFYVTAKKFPDAVPEAYQDLQARITDNSDNRRYFGISFPGQTGTIICKAAAEELQPGEAEKYHCETFTIRKGRYVSIEIKNHLRDPQCIGKAFQQLLAQPGIDPQGYCLECLPGCCVNQDR